MLQCLLPRSTHSLVRRTCTISCTNVFYSPGSTLGLPRSEALARIASQLNRAHKETKSVKTILENMAGQGNIIGAVFEDLRDIIEQVKDKNRVGVCLDTCHLFVCGLYLYD